MGLKPQFTCTIVGGKMTDTVFSCIDKCLDMILLSLHYLCIGIKHAFTIVGACVIILWIAGLCNIGNFAFYYGSATEIHINTKTKQIKEFK